MDVPRGVWPRHPTAKPAGRRALPALAAQSPASRLSLHASASADKSQGLAGVPVIALVAVAAVAAGVIIIATDKDDDPDSP
jgi:hypothetical protein